MYHDRHMTEAKIAQRIKLIEPLAYRKSASIGTLWLKPLPDATLPNNALMTDALDGWQPIAPNELWGGSNFNFAMRGSFSVPADFDRDAPIALFLPLGDSGEFSHPEALVYIDGQAYASTDRHHQEFLLPDWACDGQPHTLFLHGWTGILGSIEGTQKQITLYPCSVVEIDTPTRELLAWARMAHQASTLLDDYTPTKTRLLNALDACFKHLDTREPLGSNAFYASVPQALALLKAGVQEAGEALDVTLITAGHAHIDVAWLWTLDQTRRKAGRTFHTALRLLEQFPDYHFTQSQPQLYAYVAQDYPQLFEDIRTQIEQGRWEAIGGMWVEADCNLTGAESLARQFLLGRNYFRHHFGKEAESPVLWLPDVFGYAWNLPQLIKLAGLEYFFTIKIGWNQVNKLPYDSFWWQGLDGTKVLTHFSTTPDTPWNGQPITTASLLNSATYNANLNAFAVIGSWKKSQHKETQRVLLMSYGYGDGGGGPTREMNENAQVLAEFPSLAQVKQGKVIDFFRQLEAESGHALPTWNSELYLEIHRGTYTSQGRNKRANRKSEFLLHDAEFLASLASVIAPTFTYPHETLQRAWETVCLNQFHDIIPGSSIHEVYEESLTQYDQVKAWTQAVQLEAISVLKAHVDGDLLLVNPTSFERDDLIFWAGEVPIGQTLNGVKAIQPVEGGVLIAPQPLAPYSVQGVKWSNDMPHPDALFGVTATPTLLENAFLRVELNTDGDITRIYDKRHAREVLAQGQLGNQWQAFEDRPLAWDAWDVDVFYEDKCFLADPAFSVQVVEQGALRATLEIKRRILNSSYTQRLSLTYNSTQIDFHTVVDWNEKHIFLKTAFPVAILSPVANYEVQWGHVQRPTHRNTSWDWARFETCAQKWADLSETNYGVALLNDCKYGYDIHDNVMRLSLLRSATHPDPHADEGIHEFTYSLFVHDSTQSLFDVTQRAYCLNNPILVYAGTGNVPAHVLNAWSISGQAVIETVKRAEDGNGLIVRLYQSQRVREWVTLRAPQAIQGAFITNLLEENQDVLQSDGGMLKLFLTPFQIVTVRVVF